MRGLFFVFCFLNSGTIAIGGKRLQYRTGLNSKYSKNKWGFIGKEQVGVGGWSVHGKLQRGDIKGRGEFSLY